MTEQIENTCEEMGPRLAAMILGELEDAETVEVETHLEACAECRSELEELRATTALLEERFAAEAGEQASAGIPVLSDERVAELVAGNVVAVDAEAEPEASGTRKGAGRGRWWFYSVGSLAAAACLAVVISPNMLGRSGAGRFDLAANKERSAAGPSYSLNLEPARSGSRITEEARLLENVRATGYIGMRDQSDGPDTYGTRKTESQGDLWTFGSGDISSVASREKADAQRSPDASPVVAEIFEVITGDGEAASAPAVGTAVLVFPDDMDLDGIAADDTTRKGALTRSFLAPSDQPSKTPALQVASTPTPRTGDSVFRGGMDDHYSIENLGSGQRGSSGWMNDSAGVQAQFDLAAPASVANSSIRLRGDAYLDDQSGFLEGRQFADYDLRQRRSRRVAPQPEGWFSRPVRPNPRKIDSMYFRDYGVNPFVETGADPLSTFSADVDKASYAVARSYLNRNALPPAAAIRIEELINYFTPRYAAPTKDTFAVYGEMTPSPFRSGYHLLKIGIKGREISATERKPLVLTFVVDVSGSMGRDNRLGLVKRTLNRLIGELRHDDRIGIVVYGSRGKKLLNHTSMRAEERIKRVVNSMSVGGSTNAEEGLRIGYEMADAAFDPRATNRVILCSDGVANVGQTGPEAILRVVARKAGRDIYLTTIGFGMGNYNDVLMEQLADKGNGHYAYLDSDAEAKRFIEKDLIGSMQVIAQDVKIQVEFDPEIVTRYRLLGYENRDVADHDFRNDYVDAGEIGSGHAVTALYEIQLTGKVGRRETIATVRLRYKQPDKGFAVRETVGRLRRKDIERSFRGADEHTKIVAIAAQYGEVLRRSYWARDYPMGRIVRVFDESFSRRRVSDEAAELRALIVKADGLIRASYPESYRTDGYFDDRDADARPLPAPTSSDAPIRMSD